MTRVATIDIPGKQTLTRLQRLTDTADFSRVFKNNQRSSDDLFTVLGRLNDLEFSRLGLAISIKAAGNAVKRNRLKRTVRESFRLIDQDLPAIDFVVMARPPATKAEAASLRRSLDKHWKKVSLKCAA